MYDLIVFGATGFTGKHVVETIVKTLKAGKGETFTYAVAGRSLDKLKVILREISDFTGEDLSSVAKIQANVDDQKSLVDMASQGKVVLNCVGPYRFSGKDVVEACISAGAHCVDISGEPEYLETVQLKCDADAREKGVYIVGSCGADSIPADMGVIHLIKNFGGDVNSVEEYIAVDREKKFIFQSTKIHYGTWASLIHGLANVGQLRAIREELCALEPRPPKPKHAQEPRSILHYSDTVSGWCLPFPTSDHSVVWRSQNFLFRSRNQRPVQFQAYMKIGSFISALLVMIAAVLFGALIYLPFGLGIKLLLAYPRLCSFGFVTHEGPTRKEMDDLKFTFTLVATGWSEQLTEPTDQHQETPNKTKIVEVSGENPGYGATCVFMLQSALTILKEKDNMPSGGGVYPPGAAFADTKLIERLQDNGIEFKISDM